MTDSNERLDMLWYEQCKGTRDLTLANCVSLDTKFFLLERTFPSTTLNPAWRIGGSSLRFADYRKVIHAGS